MAVKFKMADLLTATASCQSIDMSDFHSYFEYFDYNIRVMVSSTDGNLHRKTPLFFKHCSSRSNEKWDLMSVNVYSNDLEVRLPYIK